MTSPTKPCELEDCHSGVITMYRGTGRKRCPSEFERTRFCSVSCSAKWRSRTTKGKEHRKWGNAQTKPKVLAITLTPIDLFLMGRFKEIEAHQ